ncbi:hypothetical protein V8B97DRAFT_1867985 [Scleroderma yunnanense]
MQPVPSIHIEAAPQAFLNTQSYMDYDPDVELIPFGSSMDARNIYTDFSQGLLSGYDSQTSPFDSDPPLNDVPPLTGPDMLYPEYLQMLSNAPHSPVSSYNGSQSPLSVQSELSFSESESNSPNTPEALDDTALFPHPRGPIRGCRSAHPLLGHRHASSESIATAELLSLPPTGHHRSHSMSSLPRARVATQAMLEANERRRRHPAQFKCPECQQEFTAQFSLKRHQQSHTGERLHVCSIRGCGQKFFNSSDCKRHEKSKKRHANLPS